MAVDLAAFAHNFLDAVGQAVDTAPTHTAKTLKKPTCRELAAKVLLDHLRKRLVCAFVSRQDVVGFHIDGDGFDSHALIMHLH